jgi:hypothetical protein
MPSQESKRVAMQIAGALGEKDKMPQHQIRRIVEVCGSRQALLWLKEAQQVEAQGGMPTSDGQGRRTPGGIYFKLVRSTLLQTGQFDKMQIIFRGKRPPAARKPRKPSRQRQASGGAAAGGAARRGERQPSQQQRPAPQRRGRYEQKKTTKKG